VADIIKYGREEGGFSQWVNGKKVAVFRIKGWMNNLRETPPMDYRGNKSGNNFLVTQIEYQGQPLNYDDF
jgi:hypothetical protein